MGKYKILKKLGEGSFGTVFLVEDEKDHGCYVLKQISLTGMTAQELADCKKEISILSLLNHENIVKYIRSFTTKSTLCIVMEYADGGDLQKEIETMKDSKKYFDEDRVLTWFTQVACALQHVHSLRILHRDLKAQNIFLMKNGDVKLGDFGISRVLNGTMDKATTLVGTPYYLSPEMVNGQPYNQRTDIWALGIVLYEMLTLARPFQADSLQMLVLKIIAGDYPPIPSQYSDEMKTLLGHCLQQDPNKRYTIEQVLDYPSVKRKIKELGKKVLHENSEEMKVDEASTPGPPLSTEVEPSPQPKDDEDNVDVNPGSNASQTSTPAAPVSPPPVKKDVTTSTTQPTVDRQVSSPATPYQDPKVTKVASGPEKVSSTPQGKPEQKTPVQPKPPASQPPAPISRTTSDNTTQSVKAAPVKSVNPEPKPTSVPRASGNAVSKLAAHYSGNSNSQPAPVRSSATPEVTPIKIPENDQVKSTASDDTKTSDSVNEPTRSTPPVPPKRNSQAGQAPLTAPASAGPSGQLGAPNEESDPKSGGTVSRRTGAQKFQKRYSGVGPRDKKLPTIPPENAGTGTESSASQVPVVSNAARASGVGGAAAGKKPVRGAIEVNVSAGVASPASPQHSSKNGAVPQTPREIEEDKANEEEEQTEDAKEKLRKERVSGKVQVTNESYVSKSDQVKILRKHLLERLGKEKLDRLLTVLESKADDRTKAEQIQELTTGKKDVLAMIHAYIYYSKP